MLITVNFVESKGLLATGSLIEPAFFSTDPCTKTIYSFFTFLVLNWFCRLQNASSVRIIGREEIVARLLKLQPNEIYKTMTADLKPGLWQDVYKTQEAGTPLYIKLQKSYDGKGVVIQLKRDTSY